MIYRFVMMILMSLFIIPGISGQEKSKKFFVTGTVTDAMDSPVAGAMILVDNKSTSKVTDKKGFFKVKVKPDAMVISAFTASSGLGEAMIDGESVLRIKLTAGVPLPQAQSKPDSDDQVNIGYGTIAKKDLTSSVNSLHNVNTKYAAYTSIYDVLKGTVPGVQVTGNKITIRGPSSINLSNEPLFIVDGMEVQSIEDIQPSMVESIEFLKGSSASIYGTRGANGVILIKLIDANSRK